LGLAGDITNSRGWLVSSVIPPIEPYRAY